MSLRKSYGSVLVILKIVRLPGTIIASKSSLLVLEQNVLDVIDCGGRTKFDILLTTGAKASLGSFEIASMVLRIISSSSCFPLEHSLDVRPVHGDEIDQYAVEVPEGGVVVQRVEVVQRPLEDPHQPGVGSRVGVEDVRKEG